MTKECPGDKVTNVANFYLVVLASSSIATPSVIFIIRLLLLHIRVEGEIPLLQLDEIYVRLSGGESPLSLLVILQSSSYVWLLLDFRL